MIIEDLAGVMWPRESGLSAAELVVTVPPTDDAGARTADLYEWQAVMAAADGLRLYLEGLSTDGQLDAGDDCRILCERHEDWVLIRGEDAELVSAKHPGLSYGAYTTMNSLADDGGLAHLFNRWLATHERTTCRLVTTAGLDGPPKQLMPVVEQLRDSRLAGQLLIVDGEVEDLLNGLGKALLKHCAGLSELWRPDPTSDVDSVPTSEQRQQIARFLSVLNIEHGPRKDYVGYAAPSMYARPVLNRLGSTTSADAVWGAVLSLFRARMRAAGPTPNAGLPIVLANPLGATPPNSSDLERNLAARIVALVDIDVAVRAAMASPEGFQPLPRMTRSSRLATKMTVGECSDNTVERAEQLRLDYQDFWRDRTAVDPMARTEQARLRRSLLRISDTATSAVATRSGPWGTALWSELQRQLDAAPTGTIPPDMDVELALGGICELSNRCQVWFSERFDIDAEIARMRDQRGTRQ
ncbi:hypothetical protein ACI2K4_22440 [Micromonospora sp. NPDC050397]|uniref:hypothetical protein n=1 Tax=Micromonospora sp. NPDC050397 TaxID=3364279 RepID=UPI00384BD6D2